MAQERFAPMDYSTEFDPEAFARQIKQQAAQKDAEKTDTDSAESAGEEA